MAPLVTAPASVDTFDFCTIDAEGFFTELKALRAEAESNLGEDDFQHLRKQIRWGQLCTFVGVATSWIAPNPISAIGLGVGRSWRWGGVRHHIAHRAYDRVPGVPASYTSKVYGRGLRRYFDFVDWLPTEAWAYEHNVLHHSYTSDLNDPDLIERNAQGLLGNLPRFIRYILVLFASLTWRTIFFGPNSYRAWKDHGRHKEEAGGYTWKRVARNLFDPGYLSSVFIPVALLLFVAFPFLFLPLGWWAVFSVFCNSLMAEAFANAHLFLTVLPNHAGSDLYRYDDTAKSPAERSVRQVISTVNYGTNKGDLQGFATLWLNYHIEHHVFPDLPILKYKQIQPKLQGLCAKYGIPYRQERVLARMREMLGVVVGRKQLRRMSRNP